jgi:hypothetical protein
VTIFIKVLFLYKKLIIIAPKENTDLEKFFYGIGEGVGFKAITRTASAVKNSKE